MPRTTYVGNVLFLGLCVSISGGCLALSFGGKTQTVDHVVAESPDTLKRIDRLESRVQALEQHVGPQLSSPEGELSPLK